MEWWLLCIAVVILTLVAKGVTTSWAERLRANLRQKQRETQRAKEKLHDAREQHRDLARANKEQANNLERLKRDVAEMETRIKSIKSSGKGNNTL